MQMVWDDLRPRDILNEAAFENAAKAVLAVGGSVNCIKHLQGIAREAETGIDVYALFERFQHQVPVLAALRPVGERLIEEFEAAGGARALLAQLVLKVLKEILVIKVYQVLKVILVKMAYQLMK